MANNGAISAKRFVKEFGKSYAFRHKILNVQIRFPCFQDGDKWIVTHGFDKPGGKKKLGKWPQSEVDRAEEIKKEYEARKKEAISNRQSKKGGISHD